MNKDIVKTLRNLTAFREGAGDGWRLARIQGVRFHSIDRQYRLFTQAKK